MPPRLPFALRNTAFRQSDSLLTLSQANNASTYTDSPPPYSKHNVQQSPRTPRGGANTVNQSTNLNDSDPYGFLANFDTVFLIDDSGSMTGRNWTEAREALASITDICTRYDRDGIDIYFLNHRSEHKGDKSQADGGYYNIDSSARVFQIFNSIAPRGLTPTGQRLRSIMKPYLEQLKQADDVESVKPVNVIVITDGAPTDEPEQDIVQAARRLDKLEAPSSQLGIQFFQVGGESGAAEALKYLDDELGRQGVRDMVDTIAFDGAASALTGEGILKVVLGAVMRRIDRSSVANLRAT